MPPTNAARAVRPTERVEIRVSNKTSTFYYILFGVPIVFGAGAALLVIFLKSLGIVLAVFLGIIGICILTFLPACIQVHRICVEPDEDSVAIILNTYCCVKLSCISELEEKFTVDKIQLVRFSSVIWRPLEDLPLFLSAPGPKQPFAFQLYDGTFINPEILLPIKEIYQIMNCVHLLALAAQLQRAAHKLPLIHLTARIPGFRAPTFKEDDADNDADADADPEAVGDEDYYYDLPQEDADEQVERLDLLVPGAGEVDPVGGDQVDAVEPDPVEPDPTDAEPPPDVEGDAPEQPTQEPQFSSEYDAG